MAEVEPSAGAESVACEGEDASLPVKETVPKATEERLEEEALEAAVEATETQDAPDNKRKLNDVEPFENSKTPAKKQQICISEATSDGSAPAEDQGTKALDEAARDGGSLETDSSGQPITEEPEPVAEVAASDSAQGITAVDGNAEEQSGQNGEIGGACLMEVKMEDDSLGNREILSTNNIQHPFVDDAHNPSLAPQQDDLPHAMHEIQDDLPHAMHEIEDDLSSSSRKIEVPNNKVGILIGKSGETIRLLQINSGARIQITKDADVGPLSSTRPVELIGTMEDINKAEQLIKNVIAEADAGGSPSLVARGFSTSQPGSEQIEIQIPNGKVGVIIGKGGGTIKNMQTKTGARIQLIPQHLPEGDSSRERTVRITGNKEQVESAKEMIKDVMNQPPIRSSSSHSNPVRPPHVPAPLTQWGPLPTAATQQTVNYSNQQIGMYPPQTTQYPPQPYNSYSQQPPTRGTYNSSWDQQRPPSGPMQTTPPQPGGYDYYNQGGFAPNNQPSNPLPGSVPASTPAPINYNYAQPQPSDAYGNSAPYAQPPINYNYGKPAYGEALPSYGTARPAQPGELMYQGAPPQQAPYSQAYPPSDGYSQQPSGGYLQQPAPVYNQSVPQSSGYSQYPSSQPSYDQTAQTNVNYGYPGAAPDAAYVGNAPNSGYAAQQPVGSQVGYSQPQTNPSGYYDQSMMAPPQSGGYAVPGAPVGYSNSVSPQPGYGGQYDSAQIYGQH